MSCTVPFLQNDGRSCLHPNCNSLMTKIMDVGMRKRRKTEVNNGSWNPLQHHNFPYVRISTAEKSTEILLRDIDNIKGALHAVKNDTLNKQQEALVQLFQALHNFFVAPRHCNKKVDADRDVPRAGLTDKLNHLVRTSDAFLLNLVCALTNGDASMEGTQKISKLMLLSRKSSTEKIIRGHHFAL